MFAFTISRTEFARTGALAAAMLWGIAAAGSAPQQSATPNHQPAAKPAEQCPSVGELGDTLSRASEALQQSQYELAIKTLRPASTLACDPRVSLLLAAALESSGDLPRAEHTLQEAHSAWPANTSIATSLAREYLNSGETQQAAKALEHFHATTTTPWQEMQLGVVAFLASQQLAKAAALAQLGYRTYPSIQSLLLLANALQLEGRYKDVIALLESKRSTYADSATFLATLAESEYDDAIYNAARADAERAISLDHSLYAAHYLLGNILLKQGDAEPAASQYKIAVQLEPNQPRTYYYLALALRAQHDETDEESVLTEAIALDSHYALAHCEMGRILLSQNRLPDAVAQLNLAVEDNASSEQAYYLLSKAYDRLGDEDKADAMAKRLAAVRKANHRESTGEGEAVRSTAP